MVSRIFLGISGEVDIIARWFLSTARAIEGIPFVGEFLATPFWYVHFHCVVISGYFWDLSRWVQDSTDLFDPSKYLDFLRDAIRHLFDGVGEIITSPIIWLMDMVAENLPLWIDFTLIIQDRIIDYLQGLIPGFSYLILDPIGWFRSELQTHFPSLYWFSINPMDYIVAMIYMQSPFLRFIFDDPLSWLKSRLSDITTLPTTFWDDPLGSIGRYVRESLMEMIEDVKDDLYGVGEHLLRYFFEGVW